MLCCLCYCRDQKSSSRQSRRILPQDSCYSFARLHYFRTGFTIFISVGNFFKSFIPGTHNSGDGEHDFVGLSLYEKDLVEKYLLDQEIMLWKRKWAQCSLEERTDSLNSAMKSAFQIYFASLRLIAHSLLQAAPVKGVSPHCTFCTGHL